MSIVNALPDFSAQIVAVVQSSGESVSTLPSDLWIRRHNWPPPVLITSTKSNVCGSWEPGPFMCLYLFLWNFSKRTWCPF